jgi:phosphoheptose isomerase
VSECEAEAGIPTRFRTFTPPAASRITDPRAAVLPGEARMLTDLEAALSSLNTQVRALVTQGSTTQPWINAQNPNIQEVFSLIDALQGDLGSRSLIIRFDQPAGRPVAASYTSSEDVMHLRAFTNAADATPIVADLLHEYAHVRQDRSVEAAVATSTGPRVHTAEAELQQEIGGRRVQTYLQRLMVELHIPLATSAQQNFNESVSAGVFVNRFERERTGTAAVRSAATREIRSEVGSAYSAQIAQNAPALDYRIEISDANDAVLYAGATQINLGPAPNVTERGRLESALSITVGAHPRFASLFPAQGRTPVRYATFLIFYQGRKLGEFSLPPP